MTGRRLVDVDAHQALTAGDAIGAGSVWPSSHTRIPRAAQEPVGAVGVTQAVDAAAGQGRAVAGPWGRALLVTGALHATVQSDVARRALAGAVAVGPAFGAGEGLEMAEAGGAVRVGGAAAEATVPLEAMFAQATFEIVGAGNVRLALQLPAHPVQGDAILGRIAGGWLGPGVHLRLHRGVGHRLRGRTGQEAAARGQEDENSRRPRRIPAVKSHWGRVQSSLKGISRPGNVPGRNTTSPSSASSTTKCLVGPKT